jgi:hypothetical protein
VRLAAFAATLLVATSASANGRFPAAGQLVSDADRIVARTTFGLVQSTDGGNTWRWICEERIGFSGTYDPALAMQKGTLLVTLPTGLARNSDRGCTFEKLLSEPFIDVTAGFYAVSTTSIYADTTKLAPLPEDLVPTTIEAAPPHVYVAGVGAFKPFATILHSEGGAFSETTFDMKGARAPYLAGIDANGGVWLRLDGGDDGDRLLVSNDRGVTFRDVRAFGKLLGFALSPDGKRVAAGGPSDGLWLAPIDGTFARVGDVRPRCLTWTTAGLWACSDESADGFAIGLSSDDGKTFQPKLRYRDLQPLECVRPQCDGAWRDVSALIGEKDAGVDAATGEILPQPGPSCGCATSRTSSFSWGPWMLFLALFFARGAISRSAAAHPQRGSPPRG